MDRLYPDSVKGGAQVEGKEKLAVDLPKSVKDELADLAYRNKLNLTQMVIKLIKEAKY